MCCSSPTQLLLSVCWECPFLISTLTFPHSLVKLSLSVNKNSIILITYASCCWVSSGSVVGMLTFLKENVRWGHKESNTADKYNPNWTIFRNVQHFELLRITLQILPMLCHGSSLRLHSRDWEEATETRLLTGCTWEHQLRKFPSGLLWLISSFHCSQVSLSGLSEAFNAPFYEGEREKLIELEEFESNKCCRRAKLQPELS